MNRLLVSLTMLSLLLATLALFHRRHTPSVQGWPDHIEEISAARFWQELDRDGLGEQQQFASFWRPLSDSLSVEDSLASLDLDSRSLSSGPHLTFIDMDATRLRGKPTLQNVQGYQNASLDVWVLRQRTYDEPWHLFALVQNKSSNPNAAYFYRHDAVLGFARVVDQECYSCHANGPRTVYPARPDLVNGAHYIGAVNRYCRSLLEVVTPDVQERGHLGTPLEVAECAACHSKSRSPLYRVHSRMIFSLTSRGLMPPGGRLSRQGSIDLEAWLESSRASSNRGDLGGR